MEMNVSSRISNQTAINYAERNGYEIVRPRDDPTCSPRKKKNSDASTTKQWVEKSFYTSKFHPKNSASVFPDVGIPPPAKNNGSKKVPEKWNPGHKGEYAVYFDESQVHIGAEKFKFSLVGKFTEPKPSLEKIREWAGREWKLEGECSITSLDRNHVFVRLENEADMIRIWPRNRWFVGEHLMKVFKWLPSFRASSAMGEPSLAAVWISFPHLPVVFFQEVFLYKIASLVGRVFRMDGPTKNMSRTSIARVCVEVDLVKDLPKKLWIGIGKDGFWQEVCYESLPRYCTNCLQQGHPSKNCQLKKPAFVSNGPQQKNGKLSFKYTNLVSGFKDDTREINEGKQCNTCPVVVCKEEKEALLTGPSCQRLLSNGSASLNSRNMKRAKGATKSRDEWKIQKNLGVPASNKKPRQSVISSSEQNHSDNGLVEKPSQDSQKVERNLSVNKPKKDLGEKMKENGKDVLDDADISEKAKEQPTLETDTKGKRLAVPEDMVKMGHGNSQLNQLDKYQQEPGVVGNPTQAKSPQLESANGKKKFPFNKTIFCWRSSKKVSEGNKSSGPSDLLYLNTHTAVSQPKSLFKTGTSSSQQSSLVTNPCRHFSMAKIKSATHNFALLLGDGGFGRVYKGVIDGGTEVAIKRCHQSSKQGMNEFQTEIDMLSKLRHRHLVSLIGVCTENDEKMLVYDFMSRGSLKDLLYSKHKDPLSWKRRLNICTGAARGLQYLDSNGIIHRDVKPTNILVDRKWDAKVADFGVSKEGPAEDETHISTHVKGTPGYLDPEYVTSGHLTIKSDVYSFGVVLLEVLFGWPPIVRSLPSKQGNLKTWAQRYVEKGILDVSIDSHLRGNIKPVSLQKFSSLALSCVEDEATLRPEIEEVLNVLEQLLGKKSKI